MIDKARGTDFTTFKPDTAAINAAGGQARRSYKVISPAELVMV